MAIETCHICEGAGRLLRTEMPRDFKPGMVAKLVSDTCLKCLGSGLLDVRAVEAKPAKKEE